MSNSVKELENNDYKVFTTAIVIFLIFFCFAFWRSYESNKIIYEYCNIGENNTIDLGNTIIANLGYVSLFSDPEKIICVYRPLKIYNSDNSYTWGDSSYKIFDYVNN